MMPGEIIKATTTVASIWNGRDVMISDELYEKLKVCVGTLTLTNSITKQVIHIRDCISNAWIASSDSYANLGKQEGGASLVVSHDFAVKYALQLGTSVELTNTLTPRDVALWKCGEDKTNEFGSCWMIHRYIATAFFAGYNPIFKSEEQAPGLYLNQMQLENLNLKATLRPLCGLTKFKVVRESSPEAVGIVKLFYDNQVIEAAVYPTSVKFYPSAAIMINDSLHQKLQGIQIGYPLRICSRFDVENYETAESLQNDPELESIQQTKNWIEVFQTKHSIEDIFINKFGNSFDDRLLLADVLDDLTKNAKILASDPSTLLKVINFMDFLHHEVPDTQEYKNFLQAVSKEEVILKEHQEQIFILLTQELLNETVKYNNPPFLDALFAMGINLKNGVGENYLHVMYRLGRGTCEGSSSDKGYKSYHQFKNLMIEKTSEGKTPLHYLCQRGDWKEVFAIRKKLKKFNPNDFISEQGTPFHDLVDNLGEKVSKKYLTLIFIVKYLGRSCISWFNKEDFQGLTPLKKMQANNDHSLIQLLAMLKTVDDKDAELKKDIFNELLISLKNLTEVPSAPLKET